MNTQNKIAALLNVARRQKRDAATSLDLKNLMVMTVSNIKAILAEDGEEAVVTYNGNQIMVAYVDYDEFYRV